jgi:hypothetical protein
VAFVAIAALVCYARQAPQRPQNLDLVQLLPSANVALPAMATILGGDQALRTLQTARLVYRHFIYNEVGHPREAIPVALATLFESNIGQCDSAARLFAQMRAADGDSRFRQFDLTPFETRSATASPDAATAIRSPWRPNRFDRRGSDIRLLLVSSYPATKPAPNSCQLYRSMTQRLPKA